MPRFSNDEAEYVRTPPSVYAPLAATAIPANTAVNVVAANSMTDGALIANSGTVPLTYSLTGTANAASIPLPVGASVPVPAPTAQALSVFNPSTTTAGSVAGYVY